MDLTKREEAFARLNRVYHLLVDAGLDELAEEANQLQKKVAQPIPSKRTDEILNSSLAY